MSALRTSQTDRTPADAARETTVQVVGLSGSPIDAKVVDTGTGPPIVFLHGLVGLNDHWEEVVKRVCHSQRCITLEIPLLDLRGKDCSIDGVTELTSRFLSEYLDGPAVLVGNSFGGHVALRLALDEPKLVRALVLAGASGLLEKTLVADVQIRPSREWLSRKIGELFYDPSQMSDGDLDRAHAALSKRDGARAMVRLSRTARRNHLGDRISEIEAPTLLIWGENDVVTPPEAAHEFLEKLQDSRIVWLPQCGHAPMLEKADEFAQAILAFSQELEQANEAS